MEKYKVMVLVMLIFASIFLITPGLSLGQTNECRPHLQPDPSNTQGLQSTEIYNKVVNGLVYIQGDLDSTHIGSGSGEIFDPCGDIVTNNHVINGLGNIKVTYNGQQYDATVVGSDPQNDLAVLNIQANTSKDFLQIPRLDSAANIRWESNGTYKYAVISPSTNGNDLTVGQPVYALGFPQGLKDVFTTGVVSGNDRVQDMELGDHDIIYINAVTSPGSSGGALLDQYGRLIGITEGGKPDSNTGYPTGIEFAIPYNIVIDSINTILPIHNPGRTSALNLNFDSGSLSAMVHLREQINEAKHGG
jgi:S1-C subfamily serine protease